jgi:hypothetical protein
LAQTRQAPTQGFPSEAANQKPEEMAKAPGEAPPTRHRIVYTDQYGFHFDRNGLLLDDNGYLITARPR